MRAKSSLLISCVVCCIFASAQKTISVLSGGTWTFYSDFSTAISQCSAGSTIYLPGGNFTISHGQDTIDKPLTLLGVGFYPDSTIATYGTALSGELILAQGANNVFISGVKIDNIRPPYSGQHVVTNVTVSRCRINQVSTSANNDQCLIKNLSINESIVGAVIGSGNYDLDLVVSNSIVIGWSAPHLNALFKNCLLFYTVGCNGCSWLNFNHTIFENNVIFNFTQSNTGYCSFRNNLILSGDTSCSYCSEFYHNKFGIQSSTFVNCPTAAFDYSYDYHIVNSSPGRNAGSDGTDVGIYGTSFPYKSGLVPANPHLSTKSISPSSLPNGTLPVNIRVIAQDR